MKRPYREEEQWELGRANEEKILSIRQSGIRRKRLAHIVVGG